MCNINKKVLVSVVVCTYNRKKMLKNTILCLLAQDYEEKEIIIIDNNSTDGTAEMIQNEFLGHVLYFKEEKVGVAHARNRGLELAKGDLIGFIDDDEEIATDWISKIIECFLLDAKVAMASGPVLAKFSKQPPDWYPLQMLLAENEGNEAELRLQKPKLMPGDFCIGTGNSMFKKSYIAKMRFDTRLGRKGESLSTGEDTFFCQQVYERGYKSAFAPSAIVYHIMEENRLNLSWLLRKWFYEGVSEYQRKGNKVLLRRIGKPFLSFLALCFSLLTLDRRKIVIRFLKMCKDIGVYCAPFIK